MDGYVAGLAQLRSLDLDVATEFLLIAAILLELKARRLLPGKDDVDLDEELALWEERDLLLARLFECKTFKDAAAALTRHMDVRRPVLAPGRRARGAVPGPRPRPAGRGHARTAARAFLAATAPKPAPRSTSTMSPRCGSAWPTPWSSCSTSCPGSVGSPSAA